MTKLRGIIKKLGRDSELWLEDDHGNKIKVPASRITIESATTEVSQLTADIYVDEILFEIDNMGVKELDMKVLKEFLSLSEEGKKSTFTSKELKYIRSRVEDGLSLLAPEVADSVLEKIDKLLDELK